MEQARKDLTLTKNSNTSLITSINQGNLRAIVDGLSGDIKTAVKESVPVKQLINSGAKIENIVATLSIVISKFASMLSVGGNLKEGQSIEIAKMLVEDYPTLGLEDFNVMLSRGVRGRYGEIFRFDIAVIFGWAIAYMNEWADEREKLMDKQIEPPNKEEPPITPAVDVDKMLNDFKNSLIDSKIKGAPQLSKKEIREEGQSEPPRKKSLTAGRENVAVTKMTLLSAALKKLGLNTLTGQEYEALPIFEIDGHKIKARTQEEAEQIWAEVYA